MTSKILAKTNRQKRGRFPCSLDIRFYELGRGEKAGYAFHTAKCKRLDQSGMEVTSIIPLTPGRFVLVDVNLKVLEIHIPTKNILILSGKHLLTEVEWRHLNLETSLFEAGLNFIEASRSEELEPVLAQCLPSQ
jgi:hypothetical protein